MKPKLKAAHLRALCTHAGYKGSNDLPAMKKWAGDENWDIKLNAEGEPDEKGELYVVKELELEDDAPAPSRKTFTPAQAAKPNADEPADDILAKATSIALEMAKQWGLDPAKGKRPDLGAAAGTVTSVKSGTERQYEDRIKRKQAVFSSYRAAALAGSFIQLKAASALQRFDRVGKLEETVKGLLQGIDTKGYTTLTQAAGAALLMEGYDADVIRLVKDYGVARRVAREVTMTTDKYIRPKVTTPGLTVYYPQEGAAGTESTETWGNTFLDSKLGMVLVKMSRQILDDAMINIADDTAREAARAIAKVEDNSLFVGTGVGGSGTGYIPNVSGFTTLISDTSTGSRTLKSSATTPAAITLGDLTTFMGLLPQYARQNSAFHCTPEMMNIVITRLAQSQGGVTVREFLDYGDVMFAMGRPIILNNVMKNDNNTGSNTVCILYGDVSLAADFGNRMGVEIDISDQRYWDENNIGLKAIVRHDINVHSVGSSSTQSPVVALTIS